MLYGIFLLKSGLHVTGYQSFLYNIMDVRSFKKYFLILSGNA